MSVSPKLASLPLLNGRRDTVLVAPGQAVVPLAPHEVARYCVAELIPTGEPSTYRAVARFHPAEYPISREMLRKLGIGVSTGVLKRLVRAGFVVGARICPGLHVFSIESYQGHVAAVKQAAEEGRDFWSGDNLARYRAAI